MIGHATQYCLKPILSSVDRVAYKWLTAKLQANHAAAAPLATPRQFRHSWTEAFDAVHNELLGRNNGFADLVYVWTTVRNPRVFNSWREWKQLYMVLPRYAKLFAARMPAPTATATPLANLPASSTSTTTLTSTTTSSPPP